MGSRFLCSTIGINKFHPTWLVLFMARVLIFYPQSQAFFYDFHNSFVSWFIRFVRVKFLCRGLRLCRGFEHSQTSRAKSPLNHFYTWCNMSLTGLHHSSEVSIPLLLPSNSFIFPLHIPPLLLSLMCTRVRGNHHHHPCVVGSPVVKAAQFPFFNCLSKLDFIVLSKLKRNLIFRHDNFFPFMNNKTRHNQAWFTHNQKRNDSTITFAQMWKETKGWFCSAVHWENSYSISFQIEWDMIVWTVILLNQMDFHLV